MPYTKYDLSAAQGYYLTSARDPRTSPGLDLECGAVIAFAVGSQPLFLQKQSALGGDPTAWAPVNATSTPTGFIVQGTPLAPVIVNPAVSLPVTTDPLQQQYVASSGGVAPLAHNPQIAPGSQVGQKLILVGTSDANSIVVNDGTGVKLNGPSITLNASQKIQLDWDGTQWNEDFRRA